MGICLMKGLDQALDKGLVLVVNSVKKSAQLLALFAHSILEKGGNAAKAFGTPLCSCLGVGV
jgi:hypothetical protein